MYPVKPGGIRAATPQGRGDAMNRLRVSIVTGVAVLTALMLAATGPGAAAASTSGTAGAAAPKLATFAFSDALQVPTAGTLTKELSSTQSWYCPGAPVRGTRSLAQAITDARKVEDKAGTAAVRAMNASRDRDADFAELDASGALTAGDTVGALAALLAAYGASPENATVLRDLGSVMTQFPSPHYAQDAIALFNRADAVRGKPLHLMGISETATELNDRGFALIQLRQWKAAGTALAKAVSQAPLLAEAKLNLGMTLMCQHNMKQAVNMIIAGARRGTFTKTDQVGDPVTVVPAAKIIDVSHGHAGKLPTFRFPATMDDVDLDGMTFDQYENKFSSLGVNESVQASALYNKVFYKLPTLSQNRVLDLEAMATDKAGGGWASAYNKAAGAFATVANFWGTTFGGPGGGAAGAEEQAIVNAGGDSCTVEHQKMRDWLTARTQTWHADMMAYDAAQAAEWAAESKWETGLYANIVNPALNKVETLQVDGEKNLILADMTQQVGAWEDSAIGYDDFFCTDTVGPDQPLPAETTDTIDRCPPILRAASYAISYGMLTVSVTCEKLSIKVTAPGVFAPFAKISFSTNGDTTIVLGERAGGSLGSLSASGEAGVYLTVNGGSVTDVGAAVSARVGDGEISLTGQAKFGAASFGNVDATVTDTIDLSQ
jgi:tetratricopeptide (TPR) repeat protein